MTVSIITNKKKHDYILDVYKDYIYELNGLVKHKTDNKGIDIKLRYNGSKKLYLLDIYPGNFKTVQHKIFKTTTTILDYDYSNSKHRVLTENVTRFNRKVFVNLLNDVIEHLPAYINEYFNKDDYIVDTTPINARLP
jgi:hypothetical protein